jgi:hypothetical protein
MNQVISTHANFNECKKILGSVHQRNLFANAAGTVHFSGYVRYLKISTQPAAIFFCNDHRYRKINKGQGQFIVKHKVSFEIQRSWDSNVFE